MFQSISYVGKEEFTKLGEKYFLFKWKVKDTELYKLIPLSVEIPVAIGNTLKDLGFIILSGLVSLYKSKGFAAKNIARFYAQNSCRTWTDLLQVMELDCILMDKINPGLKYGQQYYQCVVNRIKLMRELGMIAFEHENSMLNNTFFSLRKKHQI